MYTRWLAFEHELSDLTCAVVNRGSLGLRAKVAANCQTKPAGFIWAQDLNFAALLRLHETPQFIVDELNLWILGREAPSSVCSMERQQWLVGLLGTPFSRQTQKEPGRVLRTKPTKLDKTAPAA